MNVSKEEIIYIANLARLDLTEAEIEAYRKNMEEIIGFANTINQVNTENINESTGISENVNRFRKDEVKEFEDEELLYKNAPSMENGMFHLPSVL